MKSLIKKRKRNGSKYKRQIKTCQNEEIDLEKEKGMALN